MVVRSARVGRGRLDVYDPNLNPYGLEVASLLAAAGFEVTRWVTEDARCSPSPDLTVQAKLASLEGRSRRVGTLLRRLSGPLALCIRAAQGPILVCWVRDPWDALVFGVRARLHLPTVVVYHNPQQLRRRGGLSGTMERWLLARARVVVHSVWLQSLAAEDYPHTVVAPHPPYAQTIRNSDSATPVAPTPRTFCFVGGLRPDKGVGNLVGLAQATVRAWRLRIIGPDRLDEALAAKLADAGVELEYVEPQPPSDAALIHGMRASTALLAPYAAPTASGSVHLAATLGIPVLCLASPSYDGLVPISCQADDLDGLAQMLDNCVEPGSLELPFSKPSEDVAAAWVEAIEGA